MPYQPFDGPIPGENFTADTKNFPWHRPPQYTNLDDCIDAIIQKILDEEASDSFLTMIEMGFTIVDVSQLIVQSGIGKGLWTTDMGILLAGPVAHILVIMARGYGLDFDLGVDPTDKSPTTAFFRSASKIDPEKAQAVAEEAFGSAESGNEPQDQGTPDEATPPDAEAKPTNAPTTPPVTGLGGKPIA